MSYHATPTVHLRQRNRRLGFTLIELMVAVAVLCILAAIAVPSVTRIISAARAKSAINEYVAGINLARSEALSRGVRVTICAAQAAGGPCMTAGGNWPSGWIVFVDDQGTPGTIDAGDEILRDRSNWGGAFASVLSPSANVTNLSFAPNGRPESGFSTGQVTFTPDLADTSTQRYVCVARTGRPRVDELPCVAGG